jgi:hypothetical protein
MVISPGKGWLIGFFYTNFLGIKNKPKLLPSPNEGSEDYYVFVVASAEMSLSMDVGIIVV